MIDRKSCLIYKIQWSLVAAPIAAVVEPGEKVTLPMCVFQVYKYLDIFYWSFVDAVDMGESVYAVCNPACIAGFIEIFVKSQADAFIIII